MEKIFLIGNKKNFIKKEKGKTTQDPKHTGCVLKGEKIKSMYRNPETPQNKRDYRCYYNAANQKEYAAEQA